MTERSIVEYFSGHEGYRCGYCKSQNSCYSHGMWAHALTPMDYFNLINRGWRRSGQYCYKPMMNVTCCPQYAIRCGSKKFTPSKSQKKVLKRMLRFLSYGENKRAPSSRSEEDPMEVSEFCQPAAVQDLKEIVDLQEIKSCLTSNIDSLQVESSPHSMLPCSESENPQNITDVLSTNEHVSPKTQAVDPDRMPCLKAKEIRRERKRQKLLKRGVDPEVAAKAVEKKGMNHVKSIEEFLTASGVEKPAHTLQLRVVPCDLENNDFTKTFSDSFGLYQKYQMTVHKDPAEKCSENQYIRFLVKNPFQRYNGPSDYGSFHHQYWLDEKLIAVGVLDVLPYCVSSVYFYYDPEYRFLSLGTYAALREIALTRELSKKHHELQYYYMGFYIHSCPKMQYKGQYSPSFLLCPETYVFQGIEKCVPKLDESKYSRLEEDESKGDDDGVVNTREVLILHKRRIMPYPVYRDSNKATDESTVKEYAGFVGKKCYSKMLLYRS